MGSTVVLGICGGIAAYKCADLVRLLVKEGHAVHVICTKEAEQFVTPLTLQTLSGNPVHRDLFDLTQEQQISHIALADRASCTLVAPATANILAKAAHGFCDDLLTTVICATTAPVLFAPSMNVHMWENKATQANVARLKELGHRIIPPVVGELACGYEGMGRLPEPAQLLETIRSLLKKS
ncbi:MAG: hypothetical protein HYV03_05155 [Deltaproteobacteria bacterium]|nr:hypothetical protein [Deltaproteobacteria bacterium]